MSTDRYLKVYKDKLIMHTENDGWTFLRRGAEAVETEISLARLRSGYPDLYAIYMAGPEAKNAQTSRVWWME
jgi:hypothetical protein